MIFHSLPCSNARITSYFGKRNTGIDGASTYHKGIDMVGDLAIYSVRRGKIYKNYYNSIRGWVVIVDHENGYKTLYQHLAEQSPLEVGAYVYGGDKIGTMGATSSTLKIKRHLHMELWKDDKPIDFVSYLQNVKGVEYDMTDRELNKRIDERIHTILNGENTTPSNWAVESWEGAIRDGITDGTRPQGYTTREQVITMLARAK